MACGCFGQWAPRDCDHGKETAAGKGGPVLHYLSGTASVLNLCTGRFSGERRVHSQFERVGVKCLLLLLKIEPRFLGRPAP